MSKLRHALENLRDKKDLVGAEIGVEKGTHAKAILTELDIKKLYLIDPFCAYVDNTSQRPKRYNKKTIAKVKKDALKNLSKFEQIVWIEKPSEQAAEDIEVLDFCYIDGNHEREHVLTDITLYWPKVKEGGLLCGHDFQPRRKPSVLEAVADFINDNDLLLHAHKSDWWIWK